MERLRMLWPVQAPSNPTGVLTNRGTGKRNSETDDHATRPRWQRVNPDVATTSIPSFGRPDLYVRPRLLFPGYASRSAPNRTEGRGPQGRRAWEGMAGGKSRFCIV